MSTTPLNKPRRLLLIANEFPPGGGGSLQRILSIYRTFLRAGWAVDVLTSQQNLPVSERTKRGRALAASAFDLTDNPYGSVHYACSVDASKVFAINGRYPGIVATPDRFALSWVPAAVILGRKIIATNHPDVIFSSSPTLSPHIVGKLLGHYSGAKWIADYRDPTPYMHNRPMAGYLNWVHKKIDQQTLFGADGITFATPESRDLYIERYPHLKDKAIKVIPNGYSAADMDAAKARFCTTAAKQDGITIYYSGELYPHGRDPQPIFQALANYLQDASLEPVTILFQGAGDGAAFSAELTSLGIKDHVKFLPRVTYAESLDSMLKADVLLLIQDELFHNQVPGKLYEYLATGRTILLKTNPGSATAKQAQPFDGVLYGYDAEQLTQVFEQLARQKTSATGFNFERNTAHLSREVQTENLVFFANSLS